MIFLHMMEAALLYGRQCGLFVDSSCVAIGEKLSDLLFWEETSAVSKKE